MSAEIGIHKVRKAILTTHNQGRGTWLEIKVIEADGTETEITLWPESGTNIVFQIGDDE
mgnify:CR=1 FL=1